ncbi:GNAT family N-acetyltransferase [Clostridiaceae bacterium M8S5]|nr:GNAT family N-acetyltransferase [Clostridiaceae bacterium M8S5]
MNTLKKMTYIKSEELFSPKTIPSIIKHAQLMTETQANIYYNEKSQPYLYETRDFYIRNFLPTDNQQLQLLAINKEHSPMQKYDHTWATDLNSCTKMAKLFSENSDFWAVIEKKNHNLIGMISFNQSNDNFDNIDLGHVWHTDYQNGCYDTEALSLIIQHAFETLDIKSISTNNTAEWLPQILPYKKIGLDITNTFSTSFVKDSNNQDILFKGCTMTMTRDRWYNTVSSEENNNPDSYIPKTTPPIIDIFKAHTTNTNETFIKRINEHCIIVDKNEFNVVGIKIRFSDESRGWYIEEATNTDKSMAIKYISNGTIKLLADILDIDNPQIIGIRTNIQGDGIFDFVIGVIVDSIENLPEHLPENSVTLTCSSCRYAKFNINEEKNSDRNGYSRRMSADEFFVNEFRELSEYVYNKDSLPFNMYDRHGNILTKYEPVKIPKNTAEKYESIIFDVVSLPDILCACSMTAPDSDEFVIYKFFDIQERIFSLDCAKMYNDDYYGFGIETDVKGKYNSYFGSRVSNFNYLPDNIEKMTIPSGVYLHISQLEFNGDNPCILYDIAYNHLDELFFKSNYKYKRDYNKAIIARFRQANTASVFIPLVLKQ